MAEEIQLTRSNASEEEPADETTKGGLSKKLLIGVAILVLIGAEIGVSYYLNRNVVVPKYFSKAKSTATAKTPADSSKQGNAELNSNIYMLDNVVINPTGTDGTRYVSLSIGLGVTKSSILDNLKERDIQIRDTVNSLLAKKTMGDFVDIDKRSDLKQEIMSAVNDKISPEHITSIYFTEFVIQ